MSYRRPSHYTSQFTKGAFDDWVKRWFVDPAFPEFPSSRMSQGESNKWKYYAYSVPGFGQLLESVEDWQDLTKYMSDHDLTWDDIDPRKAHQHFGSTPITTLAVGSSFVSKNIGRLYR